MFKSFTKEKSLIKNEPKFDLLVSYLDVNKP